MLYSPKHFQENDPKVLRSFVDTYPFVTLIAKESFSTSHIALFYDEPRKRFLGHWAKANPQSKLNHEQVLAIFHGPHGYISPSYYQTPQVPTWNYAVVHVQGTCRSLPVEENEQHIKTFFHQFEDNRDPFHNMDEKRTNGLLKAIVCFEIVELQWKGKFKMSQNKPEELQSIFSNLKKSEHYSDQELLQFMKELHQTKGNRELLD